MYLSDLSQSEAGGGNNPALDENRMSCALISCNNFVILCAFKFKMDTTPPEDVQPGTHTLKALIKEQLTNFQSMCNKAGSC